MRQVGVSAAITLLVFATGCEQSPFVPVSGRVTLDGVPVEGADILFQPEVTKADMVGTGSVARTGKNGEYTLKVIGMDREGAAVAVHRVTISAPILPPDGSLPDYVPDRIPDIYHCEGGLQYEVPPGGTDQANFELTTPKQPSRRPRPR